MKQFGKVIVIHNILSKLEPYFKKEKKRHPGRINYTFYLLIKNDSQPCLALALTNAEQMLGIFLSNGFFCYLGQTTVIIALSVNAICLSATSQIRLHLSASKT